MASRSPVRVLLVAGHPVILGVIRLSCATAEEIEIADEIGTAAAVAGAVGSVDPDVVVLDLELPDADGLSVLGVASAGGRLVLVLSERADGPTVLEALRGGARGYIMKPDGLRRVGEAICRIAEGERVLDPVLDEELVQELGRFARLSREGSRVRSRTTAREREILSLLAEGMTMRQIGRRLQISSRTVESHVAKIYRKLGVSSRVQAVAKGAALGLIELE